MATDFSNQTIHQDVKVEVTDSTGAFQFLSEVENINIDYNSQVPVCVYTGSDDSDLVEGRILRVTILTANELTDTPIYSGQPDPIIYSGLGYYSGQTQPRFVADDETIWFYGIIENKEQIDTGQLITSVKVTAKSYMKYLQDYVIEDINGFHYGNSYELTLVANQKIYPISDISTALNDIYAVCIGSNSDNLVKTKEFETWTYDHTSKELIILKPLPVDAVVFVYGHIYVDVLTVFNTMCENAGIPSAYYSGTSLAGSLKNRVWFPQGWDYLKCLNNLAEQIGFRLFQDREGIVTFAPRPLNTATPAVTWKDGAEADYRLISSISRTIQDTSVSRVRVEGAKWISVQNINNSGLIADHSDGSNVNNFGGLIDVYTTGTENALSPVNGVFTASYERDNRVAKLTGTNISGISGIRWFLEPAQAEVDISDFTGVQFDIRGNGQKYIIYLVDDSGNALQYDLFSKTSYVSTVEIPFASFVSSGALTTAIKYIYIAQYTKGLIDFTIDNIKFYPAIEGTETNKTRREIQIFSSSGTSGGQEIVSGYYCLGTNEEAASMAAAMLNRFQATRYNLVAALPHAQDPDTQINNITQITTSKYSYSDEPFEIKGFELNISASEENATQIRYIYQCQTPLTAAQKSYQAQASVEFTLDNLVVAMSSEVLKDGSGNTGANLATSGRGFYFYFRPDYTGIITQVSMKLKTSTPASASAVACRIYEGTTLKYTSSNTAALTTDYAIYNFNFSDVSIIENTIYRIGWENAPSVSVSSDSVVSTENFYLQSTPGVWTELNGYSMYCVVTGTGGNASPVETYSDNVDDITGQSLWNHQVIIPGNISLLSVSADASDSEMDLNFDKAPATGSAKVINNYEVLNKTQDYGLTAAADASENTITLTAATKTIDSGPAKIINNYEVLNKTNDRSFTVAADASANQIILTFNSDDIDSGTAKVINNFEVLNLSKNTEWTA